MNIYCYKTFISNLILLFCFLFRQNCKYVFIQKRWKYQFMGNICLITLSLDHIKFKILWLLTVWFTECDMSICTSFKTHLFIHRCLQIGIIYFSAMMQLEWSAFCTFQFQFKVLRQWTRNLHDIILSWFHFQTQRP